jgi:hypothetical protein
MYHNFSTLYLEDSHKYILSNKKCLKITEVGTYYFMNFTIGYYVGVYKNIEFIGNKNQKYV